MAPRPPRSSACGSRPPRAASVSGDGSSASSRSTRADGASRSSAWRPTRPCARPPASTAQPDTSRSTASTTSPTPTTGSRSASPYDAVTGARHITLEDERTHELDPAYGFRKLVDIAIRSVSGDATTTVEAIHRIRDCSRQLARRRFPTGCHTDASGQLRLIEPVRDWDNYVLLAFEEIRLAGASSLRRTLFTRVLVC